MKAKGFLHFLLSITVVKINESDVLTSTPRPPSHPLELNIGVGDGRHGGHVPPKIR